MRVYMKIAAAVMSVCAFTSALAACSTTQDQPTGVGNEAEQANDIWTHYENVQPPYMPTGLSQYRKNLTDAEATQVLGLNTTTFFFEQGQLQPFFWCPSHGGAVPNTAQLTNPNFVEPDPNASVGSVLIGNMDPNGVYAPTASQGTYVECLTSAGIEYLVYSEPNVVQISAPAVWNQSLNNGRGGIQVTGAPTMPTCVVIAVAKNKSEERCTAAKH